ncbi:MAG: sulfite exporter TauE/SafE family protein [Desulfobacterales bacterium]|nr:MAG: sulfite exporter TauE/SafE family protein [Desulfobacterales bacterium]
MQGLDLYSMFMLGLLGTGHCLGMCGPLIFAFPSRTGKFASHLYYHLGRTVTYVVVGALMGGIGAGLAGLANAAGSHLAGVARIQVFFSLLAAAFLMILGLSRLGLLREPAWLSVASPDKIPGYRKVLKSAVAQPRPVEMFLLGLMLGLLPCGLSFAAFARALPAGGAVPGAMMLMAFASGTVPGLLLLGTGASGLIRRYQKQSDILAGLLMIYMAVALGADALPAVLSRI